MHPDQMGVARLFFCCFPDSSWGMRPLLKTLLLYGASGAGIMQMHLQQNMRASDLVLQMSEEASSCTNEHERKTVGPKMEACVTSIHHGVPVGHIFEFWQAAVHQSGVVRKRTEQAFSKEGHESVLVEVPIDRPSQQE